ncbi:MAG: hypothetical protein J3Q66DRAFT_188451 [Benniella sp.]|nr:MAG: hypothetical protein J3Q66DRAFT_188451 [Benniella sp.]
MLVLTVTVLPLAWSELNNLGKSLRRFFKANVDLPKRERGDYAEGNWLHYMSLVSFSGEARNAAAPYISEFKRVLLATNENIAKVCSRPDVAYEAVRLFEQQEVDVAVNAHLTMRLKEAVAEPGMIATTYYQLLGELTDDRMAELKGAVLRNRDMSSVSEKPIVDPGNASVQAGAPTALEEPTVGPVTAVQSAGPLTFDRPLSDIAEGDEDKEEDEERLVRTHQPRAARSGLEREDNGRGVEESGRSDSGRRGTSAHSAVSVTDDENDEVDGDHDSRSSPGPGSVAYRTTEVLAALGREHSSLMWEKLGRVLNVYEADLSEGRRPRPNIRKRSRDLHLERDIAGLEDQMQGLLGMYHVARESGELVLRRDPKRRKTTWLEQ